MHTPTPTPDHTSFPRWPWFGFGLLLLASFAWLCVGAVLFSTVQPDQFVTFFFVLCGVGVAVVWMVLAGVTLINTHGFAGAPRKLFVVALGTPFCGLAGVMLWITDADLLVRIKLSEPALLREAERVRAFPDQGHTRGRRVGLFRVQYAHVTETGAVRFVTDFPWLFEEAGIYHDPDHTVTSTRQWPEHRTRLTGPWATFHDLD